jgi:putative transposase
MEQVERHIIIKNEAIERNCFLAARLYNFCNYHLRMVFFGKMQKIKEYEMTGLLAEFKQDDYKALPAQSSQQIVKLLYKNWKSFWESKREYEKHPEKFTGRPRPPKYKDKTGYGICIFTNQTGQARLKDGFIYFPKKTGIQPVQTKVEKFAQVRIIPQASCFVVEVVYEKQEVKNENLKQENFLTLDLGLNNFATSANNVGLRPFIINGRVLKSVNQMYNKTTAKLQSYIGNRGTSNRINKNTHYRNCFIEDKLHKISRFVVNYCVENNIGTIIIGHNKGWKDSINIGRKNNQKFVSIPHSKLIDKITYKAMLVGINVIEKEEAHTSKVDHLAYETLEHHEVYLGKRVKRGLFQSSTGKLLNADINGATGIARKVFGDSVISQIIDSGLAFNPIRLNII